ncbi:MAG: hypothetical protein WD208_08515 [Dehalococcoidia bacterium]
MKLIASLVLALLVVGAACASPLREAESITLEEASAILESAHDSSVQQDLEALCDLGGSVLNCERAWRDLGEWAAVSPGASPTVASSRVLPDQDLGNGSVSRGGRLLVVEGTDGLGREFSTDFLVFDSSGGKLVALNPVYWSGVSVSHPPSDGPTTAFEEGIYSPVLPVLEPAGPGGDGALLPGELAVMDRCLYLVDERETRWLPVFPADTASWESDALVFSGQRFEVGKSVSLGGGEASDPGGLQFSQEPDKSCDTRNVWVVYLIDH